MSPLRLSDLVPEELYGLKLQGLRHAEDPVLPTIMEIKEGTFKTAASQIDPRLWKYLNNPAFLGKANLLMLYAHWYDELKKVNAEEAKMNGIMKASKGRMPTGVVPKWEAAKIRGLRLKVVMTYLERLHKMAEEKPALSAFRTSDHFRPGEKVLCYIPCEKFFLDSVRGRFMIGTIVDDEKEYWKVGTPLVKFGEQVVSLATHRGIGRDDSVYFLSRSWFIVRPEEYKYLLEHEDYQELWMWGLRSDVHNAFCSWVEELYYNFEKGQKEIDNNDCLR